MSGSASQTLYERIGGDETVAGLVEAFYARVLADALLQPFFTGASLEKLQCMQKEFFAAALDGPVTYSGRSIAEAHAGRGIEPVHLARYLEHLLDTLKDRGLEEQEVYEIYSRIHCYADEITGKTNVDG